MGFKLRYRIPCNFLPQSMWQRRIQPNKASYSWFIIFYQARTGVDMWVWIQLLTADDSCRKKEESCGKRKLLVFSPRAGNRACGWQLVLERAAEARIRRMARGINLQLQRGTDLVQRLGLLGLGYHLSGWLIPICEKLQKWCSNGQVHAHTGYLALSYTSCTWACSGLPAINLHWLQVQDSCQGPAAYPGQINLSDHGMAHNFFWLTSDTNVVHINDLQCIQ